MFADNIVWDIDLEEGETYEAARAELELPKCVELPKRFWDPDANSSEYYEDISNWLSDEYGYCVKSFALCW